MTCLDCYGLDEAEKDCCASCGGSGWWDDPTEDEEPIPVGPALAVVADELAQRADP